MASASIGNHGCGRSGCTPAEEFESDLSPEERRFYQKIKENGKKSGPALKGAGCSSSLSGFPLKIRDEWQNYFIFMTFLLTVCEDAHQDRRHFHR
jgi:hypothetical protein